MVTRLAAYEVSEAAFGAPAVRLGLSILEFLDPLCSRRFFAKGPHRGLGEQTLTNWEEPFAESRLESLALSLLTVRAGVLAFFSRTETASGHC